MVRSVRLVPDLLDRYPHQLSGGELQRVVIARVMAMRPALVIADEPTSNLDTVSQARVMGSLLLLLKRTGAGLILISHDPELVAAVCDRSLLLESGGIRPTSPWRKCV